MAIVVEVELLNKSLLLLFGLVVCGQDISNELVFRVFALALLGTGVGDDEDVDETFANGTGVGDADRALGTTGDGARELARDEVV